MCEITSQHRAINNISTITCDIGLNYYIQDTDECCVYLYSWKRETSSRLISNNAGWATMCNGTITPILKEWLQKPKDPSPRSYFPITPESTKSTFACVIKASWYLQSPIKKNERRKIQINQRLKNPKLISPKVLTLRMDITRFSSASKNQINPSNESF